MLTRTFPMVGSHRSLRVLERNVMIYRAQWVMLVSGFFEPLFYLLSISIGLNKLAGPLPVDGRIVSYSLFVAPGMLAASAMNGAMIDSIFNTFFKLKISHSYDALLSTPLAVTDIAMGEVLWALARGTMYSASFIVCMALLGDAGSAWVVLCWPGAILTSLTFSCMGLAACTFMRTWQDFDLVSLAILPMFLFSATFYPITVYPGWLQLVVRVTPLYQGVALLRGLDFGLFGWPLLGHAAYLAAMGTVGLMVSARRLTRLLLP